MVGRNPARFLVPIALAASVAGAYLIVADHLDGGSTKHAAVRGRPRTQRPRGRYAHSTFYTVQAGDSLSQIAVRTGVPINTLEQLNQSLNPNALQPGQRIRLRR
jgi:LysM repeat protein